ncbi:MAG: hypothetical protein MUF50_01640 [Planctomycetes bacterium]|jgi:hypothetical protein|nr:hypothetical protein [Planctomycetota bacterium]
MKKVKIIVIVICSLFLIGSFWVLFKTLAPFVREKLAMKINYNNGETEIVYKNFSTKIKIKDECYIKPEMHIFSFYPWAGKICCQKSKYCFSSMVTEDSKVLEGIPKFKDYNRIYFLKQEKRSTFRIISPDGKKLLGFWLLDDFNQDSINDISNSITEY